MNKRKNSAVVRYREVSELRLQYFCEYSLFLRQQKGDGASQASKQGIMLHEKIRWQDLPTYSHSWQVTLGVLIIAFVALLLLLMW